MTQRRQDLYSIGSFASATRLSLKALRLYEQLDILRPIWIDPESSYRYYHISQLSQARMISLMRQMDMPLATIRQVLTAAPTEAEPLVRAYWNERVEHMSRAALLVEELVKQFNKESHSMSFDTQVHTMPAQNIISITGHVKVDKLDRFITDSLRQLTNVAKANAASVTGAPFGIYHGHIDQQEDGPIEVCLPIEGSVVVPPGVVARELPGGKLASVMLRGKQCDFPAILQGYDAVADWIRQNGYEMLDEPREIWHSKPSEEAQMEIAWLFS